MIELKPCPFCGNQMKGFPDYTISFKRDKKKIFGIYHEICTLRCKNCGCTIQQAGATREKAEENASKAWNRRTESQWIPCSERLPENDVLVLVTLQHFNGETDVVIAKVVKGYFSKGLEWESDDGEWTWGIEHGFAWMPLPEPYTEDADA